ncbi:MAG: FMN-binding negative transcriptional regulator [Deltaproteobacteria bacterium]|nr:FMN-binding negative transcriptional regulator [Deltaproteobacteria bacterium]
MSATDASIACKVSATGEPPHVHPRALRRPRRARAPRVRRAPRLRDPRHAVARRALRHAPTAGGARGAARPRAGGPRGARQPALARVRRPPESTAIFHGPHGYVSPIWLDSAPAVPTWNYAVVHVTGHAIARADEPFKRELVAELSRRYEAGRPKPWRAEALPEDFHHAMLSAIVAFELPALRIEAKFKLSQNRSPADRAGVIAALDAQGDDTSRALAALMRDAE